MLFRTLIVLLVSTLGVVSSIEVQEIDDESIPDYETHPEHNVLLEDDIVVDLWRNAINKNSELWTGGNIPYMIDYKYPTIVKNRILSAMREIEYDVNTAGKTDCIHFVQRFTEDNYIYILPREHNCYSHVGRANTDRQELSIGKGCERKGIIMHELIHALGFHHEQSRPDRDSYVSINWQNIKPGHTGNYNKHPESRTLNTTYDYSSIMHYNPFEFAVDGRKPVLTPKEKVPVDVEIGQRLQLSKNDVLKIQRLYGCQVNTRHVKQPVQARGDHCDFSHGFCNFSQMKDDDYDWIIQRGPSTSGPKTGRTTGLDSYAIAKASGHQNKTARLISRVFTSNELCLNFHFFLHGQVGSLSIYVKPQSGSRRLINLVSIYPQRAEWIHISKNVDNSRKIPFQVVISAATVNADVALDNVNLYEGKC